MELKRQLSQSTNHKGQSCNEYFEKMRSIADHLTVIGSPMLDSYLVHHILNGLGQNFNSFVVAITTRSDPVTIADFHGFVLTHEALLSGQQALPMANSPDLVVFQAGKKKNKSSHRPRPLNQSKFPPKTPILPNSQSTSYFDSTRTCGVMGQGRGVVFPLNFSQPTRDKPICRISNRRGHPALDCWYRFDHAYTSIAPPQFQALL